MLKKIIFIWLIIFSLITINISAINHNYYYGRNLQNNNKILEYNYSNTNTDYQLDKEPLCFTENQGQLRNTEVKFFVQEGEVWFTNDGIWFDLRDKNENSIQKNDDELNDPIKRRGTIIKQEFIGANNVIPEGKKPLNFYYNYFYGNDSSHWKTYVQNFQEIYYQNIYDNIDLRYYSTDNGLKYDYLIHPGGKIEDIKIKYLGIDKLKMNNRDDLIVRTKYGNLKEANPYIYQSINCEEQEINGRFEIFNSCEYGFKLEEEYDYQKTLVIDPNVYLDFSTYIGGNDYDYGSDIALDSLKNVIITGYADSTDFPTTPGAYDRVRNSREIILCKLDPTGSNLIYSTYIGGNNTEVGNALMIDSLDNTYICGYTRSDDFPVTQDANDTSYNVYMDCYALKLNSSGSKLVFSTYIGGNWDDNALDMELDDLGNIYITGNTKSTNFPTTPGAHRSQKISISDFDVFVLKLNNTGSTIIYATYIGGDYSEAGWGISIDTLGNSFVTGYTSSSNFPTTPGAFQTSRAGVNDCFCLKLNHNGSKLNYSTFIGGTENDYSYGIQTDQNGFVYITGLSKSNDFPTTPNAYDRDLNDVTTGYGDIILLKLNQSGTGLEFSTYIGGNYTDNGDEIFLDSDGNIWLTGYTSSTNFTVTPDAYNSTVVGDDAYIMKLDSNATSILYSSYIGGSNIDRGQGLFIDTDGNAYLTGYTWSNDFPNTTNAYNRSHAGKRDIFVLKFTFGDLFKINSFELLLNEKEISQIYSRLKPYNFRVGLTDTVSSSDLETVRLSLDPLINNIQLLWNRNSGEFSELFDPNNYVEIDVSSSATNITDINWIVNFNVTFNWNYPDEKLQNVQVYSTSATLSPVWFNRTNIYQVENDLIFNGSLIVKGENDSIIYDDELVRGGESLNWTGLTVIYENASNLFPPSEEYDITIWDEDSNYWKDSPSEGQPFFIDTITPKSSDSDGFDYTINISKIPFDCDLTNNTFTLKIDGDNVKFSNPSPDNSSWQTESNVPVQVTITDIGGGIVNGSTIAFNVSMDNGKTWSDWEFIDELSSLRILNPQKNIYFEDGMDNLIKWQAEDSVDNGPVESESFRIIVDTENVTFLNSTPIISNVSKTEKVEVGITILDNTSGINGSSIEYTISFNDGLTWADWKSVPNIDNQMNIQIKLNLTFQNGTENRIKWRAKDLAGNGPYESAIYEVNVNTWVNPIKPKIKLISPSNNSIMFTTSVELRWTNLNFNNTGLVYDVYFDITYPPKEIEKMNHDKTELIVTNLSNGVTYFWTVTPKSNKNIGFCISNVWSFSIDLSAPRPSVSLISPSNGTIVNTLRPTLEWSVSYNGTGIVYYNIYLSKDESPKEFDKSYTATQFKLNIDLENNATYYWKILPMTENITGIESNIYSFTIKLDKEKPFLDFELILTEPFVNMKPGETSKIKVIIKNLGDEQDIYSVSLQYPDNSNIQANLFDENIFTIEPDDSTDFNISISVSKDAVKSEIEVTTIAISKMANQSGIHLEKNVTLIVRIISDTINGNGHSEQPSYLMEFIMIIIIIIVAILILILFMNKRKNSVVLDKEEQKDQIIGFEPEKNISEEQFESSVQAESDQPLDITPQLPPAPEQEPSTPTVAYITEPTIQQPNIATSQEQPQQPTVQLPEGELESEMTITPQTQPPTRDTQEKPQE